MESPPDEPRRWPRSVYERGSEPDPRYTLANERTFLAWIRTALALLAGGVALEALSLPVELHWRLAASVLLIVLGIVAPVQAWLGWARTERALRERLPLPAPGFGGPLATGARSSSASDRHTSTRWCRDRDRQPAPRSAVGPEVGSLPRVIRPELPRSTIR